MHQKLKLKKQKLKFLERNHDLFQHSKIHHTFNFIIYKNKASLFLVMFHYSFKVSQNSWEFIFRVRKNVLVRVVISVVSYSANDHVPNLSDHFQSLKAETNWFSLSDGYHNFPKSLHALPSDFNN